MNETNQLTDQRWFTFQQRFHTLPVYYFNDLKYPETHNEAAYTLNRLELEIKNIDSQFSERESELAAALNEDLEESTRLYKEWRTKALRAQRMKFSQIRLIEAWMLESQPQYEERLTALEQKTEAIEQQLKQQLS